MKSQPNQPGTPDEKPKPYPKTHNVAGGERLESRDMMTVSAAVMDAALQEISQKTFELLHDAETERLEKVVEDINTTIAELEKKIPAAKAELEATKQQTLYARSSFNAELTFPPSYDPKYDAYRRAMEDHSHALRQFLDGAQRMKDFEAKGDTMNATNTRIYMQGFIDSYFIRIRGKEGNKVAGDYLRSLGMRMSQPFDSYVNEAKRIKDDEFTKQLKITKMESEVSEWICERDYAAAFFSRPVDIRPQSPLIDGTTPEEISFVDSTLEEILTETTGHTIILDQTAAEFTQLMQNISKTVGENGHEHDMALLELEKDFRDSLIQKILLDNPPTENHEMERSALSKKAGKIVRKLVEKKTADLQFSITREVKGMPALIRQRTELERIITSIDAQIVTQEGKVKMSQAEVDRISKTIANNKVELERIRGNKWLKQRVRDLERDNNALGQTLGHAVHRQDEDAAELLRLRTEKTKQTAALNEIWKLYGECEDFMREQTISFLSYAQLNGKDREIAMEELEKAIDQALQEGRDAMPHVKPAIGILKTDIGQGPVQATLLSTPVTEIREGKGPILTASGGLISALIRVTNHGDRAGPITVQIRGVSDLSPNAPVQHTLTFHLEPGQMQDIAATVAIPRGKDAPGSIVILTTTPDEPEVPHETRIKEPKAKSSGYEQGKGAVLHNAKVILMNVNEDKEAQVRLERYLAANPEEAASIVADIRNGSPMDQKVAQAIVEAHERNRLVAEKEKREIVGEIMEEVEGGDAMNEADREKFMYETLVQSERERIERLYWELKDRITGEVAALDSSDFADEKLILLLADGGNNINSQQLLDQDSNLLKEIYTKVQSLLDDIHTSIDDEVRAMEEESKKIASELTTNNNFWQRMGLVTGSLVLKGGMPFAKGLHLLVPETVTGIFIEAALTATGLVALKHAPKAIRGGLTAIDQLAGTQLSIKFAPKIESIISKINSITFGIAPSAYEKKALDLLMPGGKAIGVDGSTYNTRILKGGTTEASELFNKLIRGGEKISTDAERITYKMPNGETISLRFKSTSGPPAIDVNNYLGVKFNRIHFLHDL